MKARKKPLVIDAIQWFKHGDHPEVYQYPEKIFETFKSYRECGFIRTLEDSTTSVHHVVPGNWIMGPGVGGEFWAIQDDIFKKTYEIISEG